MVEEDTSWAYRAVEKTARSIMSINFFIGVGYRMIKVRN